MEDPTTDFTVLISKMMERIGDVFLMMPRHRGDRCEDRSQALWHAAGLPSSMHAHTHTHTK
eukprot:5478859-Amphidinium_carterae.1